MKTKAQSVLEYATLIAVIAVSLTAMINYIQRSVSARLEHVRQDLNEAMQYEGSSNSSTNSNSTNSSSTNSSEGTNSSTSTTTVDPAPIAEALELVINYYNNK